MGEHPYKGQEYFQQIKTIHESEPPKLIAKGSENLKNFLNSSLKKSDADRWSPEQLLNHPFIKNYEQTPMDIGTVCKIVDLIDDDRRANNKH
jgi:serine/threonine protein kinase